MASHPGLSRGRWTVQTGLPQAVFQWAPTPGEPGWAGPLQRFQSKNHNSRPVDLGQRHLEAGRAHSAFAATDDSITVTRLSA